MSVPSRHAIIKTSCDSWSKCPLSLAIAPILCHTNSMEIKGTDMTATTTANETFNGWANYETWNAALWIGNDEFLYNTAKACVIYREGLETPWDKFVRCMTDGQIGRMLGKTEDGVSWNDPSIDADEMNEMIWDL